MDLTDLAAYVGVKEDDPLLPRVFGAATAMIANYLGARLVDVPDDILELATLQLGSELWIRRNSPGGIAQWTSEGDPVRLSTDVMRSVRPLLARYRGLGVVG